MSKNWFIGLIFGYIMIFCDFEYFFFGGNCFSGFLLLNFGVLSNLYGLFVVDNDFSGLFLSGFVNFMELCLLSFLVNCFIGLFFVFDCFMKMCWFDGYDN